MAIPSLTYLLVSFILGAILVLLGSIVLRSNVRVGGMSSWILLAFFAPIPVLFGYTLADLSMLNVDYMLPPIAITVLLGILLVHYGLPAILPDFQSSSLGSSCVLAVMLGFSTMVGAAVSGDFRSFFPFHDPELIINKPESTFLDNLPRDERLERAMD
ncbi:MAG: hypothetical protein JJU11_04685 [Candidatus Sumerlaeia bacterium]|nr:hypothetical protein [Candidatus Sumerlaeia bacterium]